MSREQAQLGEKLVNEAHRAAQLGATLAAQSDPVHNAISRGIVRRVAGVLASEKVTPAIKVQPADADLGETVMAYTDFSSINVRYTPHSDKRLLAATLRGLMYHEGGHIRWTMPFATLVQQVINLAPNDPIYTATTKVGQSGYQWAWNALEDQRMETAVVSDSPRKAAYFTPMVLTEMVETPAKAAANWPLLIWRRYLPKHLRRGARAAFVALHGADGEALAQAFEAVTTQYVLATDFATMWDAVCKAVDLFAQHNTAQPLDNGNMGHQSHSSNDEGLSEKSEIPVDPSMLDESDEAGDEGDEAGEGEGAAQAEGTDSEAGEGTEAGAGAGESEAGDEGDDEAEGSKGVGDGTEGDEGEDHEGQGAGGSAGDHSDLSEDDSLTQQDIDEALHEANDKWLNDSAVDEDLKAYEEALNNGASKLPLYIGGISKDAAAAAVAENLADRIQQAFEMATMDRQPAWVEQQRRGVVNVNRYVTRQPGDVEYFRNWVEDDQPGYNMAVSILLDYSSSMSSYTKELAQAGYASKLACEKLGIPCTVTLWDNQATTLYDANEAPRGLPVVATSGSTDPSLALADLENQRFDKEIHLVLIMTDGQWNGEWNAPARRRRNSHPGASNRTVAYYAGQGRHFIGFGFDSFASSAAYYAENLKGYGIAESYGITNLMEIPRRLQEALIRLA